MKKKREIYTTVHFLVFYVSLVWPDWKITQKLAAIFLQRKCEALGRDPFSVSLSGVTKWIKALLPKETCTTFQMREKNLSQSTGWIWSICNNANRPGIDRKESCRTIYTITLLLQRTKKTCLSSWPCVEKRSLISAHALVDSRIGLS